jgi:anion-transporting  ArsA/GET3 family ATPase
LQRVDARHLAGAAGDTGYAVNDMPTIGQDQLTSLLSRRVQFVVGKGGVGKTTVSVALALIAARAGKRVLLIELEPGARTHAFLGCSAPAGYEASRASSGVWTLAIDGRASLEEYLRLVVPVRRVLTAIFRSKVYQYFVAAAPGLKELMAVGKVWYEAERTDASGDRRWEVVVVDAPATGHSLQYLRMPSAAREAFGSGLVRQEAGRVHRLLEDPTQTAIHLVTTAEEMPVTETIETYGKLRDELRLPAGMLVVNRVHRGVGAEDLVARLQAGAGRLPPAERTVATEVAARAVEENAWAAINRMEMERLRTAVPLPTFAVPELYAEEFGAADVGRVADLLEVAWRRRHEAAAHRAGGQAP